MSERVGVRVPKRAVPTFNFLASLESATLESILKALASKPVPVSVPALKGLIANAVSDADDAAKRADDVIGELFGLASITAAHDWDIRAVAERVSVSDGVEVSSERREEFVAFLAAALDSPAVRTLGKAADLVAEHPRRLHLARIITDLVPIFEEPENEPLGAVVVHRLRLDCFTEGENTVEVALTTTQLAELADTIGRAQQKAASLESMLGRLSMPAFEPAQED